MARFSDFNVPSLLGRALEGHLSKRSPSIVPSEAIQLRDAMQQQQLRVASQRKQQMDAVMAKEALDRAPVTVKADKILQADPTKGAPSGHMWVNPQDKTQGLRIIPGYKGEKESPEVTGKIMMMETAKAYIPKVQRLLFDEDGSINWTNVMTSDIPLVPGSASLPRSKGRELAQAQEYGLQAITRSETGAAMPQSEIDNTRNRFQPTIWDSNDAAFSKFLGYKLFVNGYLGEISKGRDGMATVNKTQTDADMSKLAVEIDNYREDWMKRALQANPTADPKDIRNFWQRKLLSDDNFLLTIAKKLKPEKFKDAPSENP